MQVFAAHENQRGAIKREKSTRAVVGRKVAILSLFQTLLVLSRDITGASSLRQAPAGGYLSQYPDPEVTIDRVYR